MIKSVNQHCVQHGIITFTVPRDDPFTHHQQTIRLHRERQVVQHGDDGVGAGEATEQPSERGLMRRIDVGRARVRQRHRDHRRERSVLQARFIASNIRTSMKYLDI